MTKHTLLIWAWALFASFLDVRGQLPRGVVMLDVSRHFVPIEFLHRQVDELARYGIPALHLHLTDAAGWRMEIEGYPELTRMSAWRTERRWEDWWQGDRHYADAATGYGGYYRQEELRALVAYGLERGVTIIPEIEFPAHSEEVTAALPWLSCTGQPYTSADLCIGADSTYLFMSDVLRQVADVFPSPYIHLGGDEAGGQSWRTCPRCQGVTQVDAMQRVNKIVHELGRKMICWDEVFTLGLRDTSVAIMVWRSPETAREALASGHEVIYAPARYCYLDKYQDQPSTQPRAMGGYLPVDSIYGPLLEAPRGASLGLCLWTEYVPTPQDVERMLWPRALALAEALSPKPRPLADFRQWAEQESLNLRARGINAYDLTAEQGQRPQYLHPVKGASVHRPVTYRLPYHPYYPASGQGALTDGLQGGWSNTDGRWQGFLGPVDVVVDLGSKRRRLRRVEVTFLQSTGVEIYLPSRVTLSVSNDSLHWTTVSDERPVADARPDVLRTHTWDGSLRARYLRLQAATDPRGGWLFTDEVLVR